MPSRLVRPSLVVICLAMLGACGSDDGAPVDGTESTEFNVIIQSLGPTPAVSVEYTVNCVSDEDSGVPDEVRLDGELELANGKTVKTGMLDTQSETWMGFVQLPPGSCLIQLRGRDDDGEIICTTEVPFSVATDTATQVSVLLECTPPGFPPVHETNLCPELRALSCDELDPLDASTSCEIRFLDGDDTCGPGCDPQTCVVSPSGLSCSPGPDPGVSTTITCTDALLDCTGDGSPDPSCTVDTRTPSTLPDVTDEVAANFFVACVPPADGGVPGVTITCTAVTSDGDVDCDKTQVVTLDCPAVGP